MEADVGVARAESAAAPKCSYASLPRKRQLLSLLLARFSEPLITSSIQSYMFFQLRYFDPSAPASKIATQSGLILSSKTAAHVCTSLLWGRLADHRRIGRKKVLVFGMLASSVATLGYGFSKSFGGAITWQILDGSLSSTIAMVRCMVAELNPEKRHRARALTLLPLFANMGSLLGPLVGGFLASTSKASAALPGHPYAAPNICVASIQAVVAFIILCGVDETLEGYHGNSQRHLSDSRPDTRDDATADTESPRYHDHPSEGASETAPLLRSQHPPSLSFRQMWSPNLVCTMLAQFIIAGHLGTFSSLWAIFLSTPIVPMPRQHPPFSFSGGLGMEPRGVGTALSLIGLAGIVLQVMIYPVLQDRFGTIRLWRAALCVFPAVYLFAPYCALFASRGAEDEHAKKQIAQSSSIAVWLSLSCVLVFFVAGRTCVVPATTLLINDCTPHPSVRGTVHTVGVMTSNLSKSIFPTLALVVFAQGLRLGAVEMGFWFLAGLAILSCVASLWVEEGDNGKRLV